MRKWIYLLLIVIIGSIMLAQSSDLTCDHDELLATQAELADLLDGFSTQIDGDPQAALAQLYEVGQNYQELALKCGYIPDDIGERTVGTDIDIILTALESVNGDPLNGQLLYNGEANAADGGITGCIGCHENPDIAPLTAGTWTRWDEIRRLEPQFEDYTFKQYAAESIILPWEYLAPDYAQVMPNNFGDRLSYQDLADLIAYLESQDQLLD
jgi:cytochrome c553